MHMMPVLILMLMQTSVLALGYPQAEKRGARFLI